MCVRARFPPISGEAETSLVEGQSNGHDWSSGIKTREKNGRKLSRGGKRGRGKGEGKKKRKKNRQSRESLALANALITR